MSLTTSSALRKDTANKPVALEHRHFAFIAQVIRGYGREVSKSEAACVADYFAAHLANTNPKFDHKRFIAACDVEA